MTCEHGFGVSTLEAVLYGNAIKHCDAKVMAQRRQSWNRLFYNEVLQNEAETCVCAVFRTVGEDSPERLNGGRRRVRHVSWVRGFCAFTTHVLRKRG